MAAKVSRIVVLLILVSGIAAVCDSFSDDYSLDHAPGAPGFAVVRVNPRIFTPNSDNVNDCFEIQYDNPFDGNVYGRVYNINGALEGEMRNGNTYNTLIWDGRAVDGDVSDAGSYIFQIEITGTETRVINGIVILAK